MSQLYRVTDPQHSYPINSVEVLAEGALKAKGQALAAMMGCPLDEVSTQVVVDSLNSLECVCLTQCKPKSVYLLTLQVELDTAEGSPELPEELAQMLGGVGKEGVLQIAFGSGWEQYKPEFSVVNVTRVE